MAKSEKKKTAVPVLKHSIFTWFPSSGFVSANTVGAKNIASSSGCAITRHIRLLYRVGKELNPEEVEESAQKTVATSGAINAVTIHEKLSVMMTSSELLFFRLLR